MSLFSALNTATSGLLAQSSAFGNISQNVSNSQTTGYKRVDTNFVDYITTSTADDNEPASVRARPAYQNNIQGSISQSDNPLALAISGNGFFAVSRPIGTTNGITNFGAQPYYTRAGDFQQNSDGYIVNSAGDFLNGWSVNSTTGAVNQNALAPIQISQTTFNPVPTSTVTLAANLPATPDLSQPITSQLQVYDSLGAAHTVTLAWTPKDVSGNPITPPAVGQTQTPVDHWSVAVNSPNDISGTPLVGSADVYFGSNGGFGEPAGTIAGFQNAASLTASAAADGNPATLAFQTNFGIGAQTITLNLGTFGQTGGVTQYAGTQYSLRGLTQNGVPQGSFQSITTQSNGNVIVNYDNGQSRVVARVPVITFNDPDALQSQNGQAFTATIASGTPLAENASTNGAGTLLTKSIEGSNVDIATEFSKLIVAQEAYSASTKLVTTSNELLQATIDMKR